MAMAQDMSSAVRIPVSCSKGVALFDLDGTLLAWDCQLLFRHFVVCRHSWRRGLLPLFLAAVPLAPLLGCDRMKRVFLSYLWKLAPSELNRLSREFADQIALAVYPELLQQIQIHRRRGDLLILASASPDCYVREIGARLGFDHSLGTEVRFGPLIPPLQNHKGGAKVARLRALLGPDWFQNEKIRCSHGYSDSEADLPMLSLCEEVTVVNPKPGLARLAEIHGWRQLQPAKPWSTKFGWAMRAMALLFGVGRDPGGLQVESWKKSKNTSR